jgi:hypothetical protein
MRSARAPELAPRGHTIDSTNCANASITQQYLLAKVARVGAKAPFVDAKLRTECPAAGGNLQIAPAAQSSSGLPS